MEVRQVYGVAVDDAESAHSSRGEVQRRRGPKASRPDEKHAC